MPFLVEAAYSGASGEGGYRGVSYFACVACRAAAAAAATMLVFVHRTWTLHVSGPIWTFGILYVV